MISAPVMNPGADVLKGSDSGTVFLLRKRDPIFPFLRYLSQIQFAKIARIPSRGLCCAVETLLFVAVADGTDPDLPDNARRGFFSVR